MKPETTPALLDYAEQRRKGAHPCKVPPAASRRRDLADRPTGIAIE